MNYENESMKEQEVAMSRTERQKKNVQKQKGKKQLPLWLKCIGCVGIPYLFILLMGVINTYAVPMNVAFVLAGSVVLLLGMVILTILTSKRKKV